MAQPNLSWLEPDKIGWKPAEPAQNSWPSQTGSTEPDQQSSLTSSRWIWIRTSQIPLFWPALYTIRWARDSHQFTTPMTLKFLHKFDYTLRTITTLRCLKNCQKTVGFQFKHPWTYNSKLTPSKVLTMFWYRL